MKKCDVNEIMQIACDEYCQWPHRYGLQEALDKKCDECRLAAMLKEMPEDV